MMEVTDIIDRPIRVGDFVVFYADIYQVLELGRPRANGSAMVRVKLADPSPTTRAVLKFSKDMCVIPAEDYTFYLLKRKQS